MATDDTAPGNGETQPLQQEQETPQKPQRKKPDPTPTMPEREDAHALTVVGIGASAGGVQALQTFFENAPTDSGSAYIVVLHLSPDHASHLAEIIGRATGMPVRQVTDVVKVEADHVYVIPPSRHLEMEDGLLRPTEPESARGRRVAIDLFFRTLADTHGPQSVAVVLSGSGADGALGLRQIKERGGLTMAQDPLEAEYDGMPRSAIATGMVDFVLPASDLARRIADYWDTSRRMRLPGEAAPSPPQRDDGPDQEAALRAILAHVRAQTGHDFAQYKRATILRRIGRRLQVNGAEDLPGYLEFVRRHPAEVGDLVKDVLISVTQFFRDASAWAALDREVVPRLFEGRRPDEAVRAWVCGCATGEEAYTLAILLQEYAQKLDRAAPPIQIFATDMDADAIARARVGVYPDTIAADVSQERLRRWFTHQNGAYRVKKEVRESVLFAAHDVLRDTPFSRLDLITCRNLLIYLEQAAQQRVYETFHFALRPGGRLLLGSSEAVDSAPGLFTPVDKQHRIYLSRPVARSIAPIPVGVSAADMPSV
ncbi:MAG TPA: chemotaxis protein CheB, partial [Armatimonadaceae bacterium]|nr:chemotaxis protein CheB [Armatimonadaceae bacterium]